MASDGATALPESIMARPLSRPHYTMPRLDVINVLETDTAPPKTNHESLTTMHTSKNDASKGGGTV
jgi:hypothetical protein